MLSTIEAINSAVNNFIWGVPAMICIIGVGLVLSFRTRFLQIRKFPYAMKVTFGRMFKKREASDGAMTPFQAVCTALAATVGTGNIAGILGDLRLYQHNMKHIRLLCPAGIPCRTLKVYIRIIPPFWVPWLNKSKKPCTMLVCIRKKILSKSSRSCNIPECSPAALKKRPPQKALPPKRPSARKKKPAGQPNAGQRLKNGPGSGSAGCCCLLFFFSL